jgi:tetratricopeptide (TPR) repeat protein
VTATYLDVAHPAGFPTYNLLAKILTWLPLGSLGFRVTIFSALCAGLAIFALGMLARKIHFLDKVSPPSLIWLLAGLPWFIFYQGIWAASVEVEVYSLNVLFVVTLLYCATCWFEGKGIIYLYFGGFIYGLACGNHGSLALYLPVLLLLTFWGQPKNHEKGVNHQSHYRIFFLSIIFLVAISVYLLLIVRSLTDSLPLDFGRTNNFENFWYHITDAKDRDVQIKTISNFQNFIFYLRHQLNNLTSPLIWLAIPFICWGLKYLWTRYQILSVALVLLMLINVGFFFYWIDGISAFLPTATAGFLLLCIGLGQFGRWLRRLKVPFPVSASGAITVALVGLAFLGQQRFSERESEAGFWATELFWHDLAKLPPESLALFSDNWFFELALKNVYMVRPDVSSVFLPSLSGSPYVRAPSPARYPFAVFPNTPSGELLSPSATDYISFFLNANISAGIPTYIQYTNDQPIGNILNFAKLDRNFMWLAELKKDTGAAYNSYRAGDYRKYLEWANQFMIEVGKSTDPPLAKKAPVNIYYCLRPVVGYAFKFGDNTTTEKVINTFIDTFIDKNGKRMYPYDMSLNANIFIVNNLMLQGKIEEALDKMKKFVELDPTIAESYYILGVIYEKNKKFPEALESFEKAMKQDPYDPIFVIQYANILAKYQKISLADAFLQEKTEFYVSKHLPNAARTVEYFRSCLLVDPEDDSKGNVNFLTDSALYGRGLLE